MAGPIIKAFRLFHIYHLGKHWMWCRPSQQSHVCSLTGGHTCHLIWALSDIATWHFVSDLLSFGALNAALTWVSVCFTVCPIGH